MKLVRYPDRPDLQARRFAELAGGTFPEYMNHNEPGDRYWDRPYRSTETRTVRDGIGTHVEPNAWVRHRVE